MNTAKQFWTLLKFQSAINPFIWFMPLAFGLPIFLPLIMTSVPHAHLSFYSLFANQNLFFVGMFGSMILAPEKFQFGAANAVSSYSGSEFLLTRAVDRSVLYRAKTAVLYLLILTGPLIVVLHSVTQPNLIIDENSQPVVRECLASVPGSELLPPKYKKSPSTLISIPAGNVLISLWQVWIFAWSAIGLQFLITLLYPVRYGRVIFWVIFFAIILVPLFDLTNLRNEAPTAYERLFFSFAAHQIFFWLLTGLVFVANQLWCEWRYTRMELIG